MRDYNALLKFYKDCFGLIDLLHYNSYVTKAQFENNLRSANGKMISITHGGISDNRQKKDYNHNGLIIGFVGNETPYKGLPLLKEAINGLNIFLDVWGGKKAEEGHVRYRGTFSRYTIKSVYNSMDLLVVPSICKETFSLVTLEALSYGVPVLVSDNVGAQDIVKLYDKRFVYHTKEELRNLLEELVLDKSSLENYNQAILDKPWNYDMKDHAQEIINKIYQ